jgi:hypothetical protein
MPFKPLFPPENDPKRGFGTDLETKLRRQRETGFILGLRLAVDEARRRGYRDLASDLAEVALSDLTGKFANMTFDQLRNVFEAGTAQAELGPDGKPQFSIVERA